MTVLWKKGLFTFEMVLVLEVAEKRKRAETKTQNKPNPYRGTE